MQTPKTFSLEIENIAKDMKMSHMDAVLYYCEKNDLEPDSVGRLITKGVERKNRSKRKRFKLFRKNSNFINIGDFMNQAVRNQGFEALETMQMRNRINELEHDCAELQKSNEELRERCKKLASRVPEWSKCYRPNRKKFNGSRSH